MKLAQSQALYERASIVPGRANTRSKKPGHMFDVGRGPMYAEHGHGARLTDVDGNSYIDMLCGLGAVSLGYSRGDAARRGVCSLPYVEEVEACEMILQHVAPWATHVRLLRTGSEATHAAYRIAKRATGRDHVLIGDWNSYHGWHEWSARRIDGQPELSSTFLLGYNGLPGERHTGTATDLAAVFIEPHRWEPVRVNWLREIREFCTRNGVLLVFDEMIYGGRWALGGSTEYFDIRPDLACFGKAIGNGAPVACVVGRKALAEHGEIVSGTYSGDADAADAICRTLKTYTTEPVIKTLWERGRQLAAGLEKAIEESGWTGRAFREGQAVHQRLRFADPLLGREFSAQMAARGVIWSPDCVNMSYAHSEAQIDHVIDAAAKSLIELTATAKQ